MAAVVSLRDVVDALDMPWEESTTYLNRKTGELVTVTAEDARTLEDGEDGAIDGLPEWQREMLPKMREAVESKDYLALPDNFDIDEHSIMKRFCYSVEGRDRQNELLNAIRDRGAFRYFKDTVYRFGIQDEWYRFRAEALEEIAIEWLEANGIEYNKGGERRRF